GPFTVAGCFSTVRPGSNCVGCRSQQADDTICTYSLENAGRIFERCAIRSCSDYGWLSMDWNADWTHAFRWGPIRSMEAEEWGRIVVIQHFRTPRGARREPLVRK